MFCLRLDPPRAFGAFLLVALAAVASGCGSPSFDSGTPLGKQAIIDAVNNALTKDDCAGAVSLIEDHYNSANSDNEIRMAMAAAYACHARFKLFTMVGDLASNSAALASASFWNLMVQLFPSTTDDRIVEGALLSTDALMSSLYPGIPIIPAYKFNIDTNNPGSMEKGDRITDANLYLVFMSMAAIGGIQSRFGNPDPTTFAKGNRLPWRTAALVDDDGCAYASAMVNMVDSLEATADAVTGSLQTSLQTISTAFAAGIKTACDIGCQNLDPDLAGPWQASGCATATACSDCPMTLRNRDACAAKTDNAHCAAAGIVNFINDDPLGFGWAGP